jgi:hypothetical protein
MLGLFLRGWPKLSCHHTHFFIESSLCVQCFGQPSLALVATRYGTNAPAGPTQGAPGSTSVDATRLFALALAASSQLEDHDRLSRSLRSAGRDRVRCAAPGTVAGSARSATASRISHVLRDESTVERSSPGGNALLSSTHRLVFAFSSPGGPLLNPFDAHPRLPAAFFFFFAAGLILLATFPSEL